MGNLHKWGYAPRGTAVLVVAAPWRDRIEPLVVSWEQNSGFPARLEWQATSDYTSWLSAPAGLSGHRFSVLVPNYTYAGIGGLYAETDSGGIYIEADFIAPLPEVGAHRYVVALVYPTPDLVAGRPT